MGNLAGPARARRPARQPGIRHRSPPGPGPAPGRRHRRGRSAAHAPGHAGTRAHLRAAEAEDHRLLGPAPAQQFTGQAAPVGGVGEETRPENGAGAARIAGQPGGAFQGLQAAGARPAVLAGRIAAHADGQGRTARQPGDHHPRPGQLRRQGRGRRHHPRSGHHALRSAPGRRPARGQDRRAERRHRPRHLRRAHQHPGAHPGQGHRRHRAGQPRQDHRADPRTARRRRLHQRQGQAAHRPRQGRVRQDHHRRPRRHAAPARRRRHRLREVRLHQRHHHQPDLPLRAG